MTQLLLSSLLHLVLEAGGPGDTPRLHLEAPLSSQSCPYLLAARLSQRLRQGFLHPPKSPLWSTILTTKSKEAVAAPSPSKCRKTEVLLHTEAAAGCLEQWNHGKTRMSPAVLQAACVTWTTPLPSLSLNFPSVKWG